MAEWFAPKSHGVGSGLPIAWQGWLLMIAYFGVVVGAGLLLAERNPWIFGSVTFTATAIFLLITAKTTKGGWRWRWGNRENDR